MKKGNRRNTPTKPNTPTKSSTPLKHDDIIIKFNKFRDLILGTMVSTLNNNNSFNKTTFSEVDSALKKLQKKQPYLYTKVLDYQDLKPPRPRSLNCTLLHYILHCNSVTTKNGGKLVPSKTIKLLINNQNINKKDQQGQSALHILCMNKEVSIEMVKLFLESHPDINAQNNNGNNPLHLACLNGVSPEVIRFLLESKFDINAQNNDGNNPLHLACMFGESLEVINVLLKSNLDISAKNNDGNNALHLAFLCGAPQGFREALLQNGFNIEDKNNDGKSIKDFQSIHKIPDEAIELLKPEENSTSIRLSPNLSSYFQVLKEPENFGNTKINAKDIKETLLQMMDFLNKKNVKLDQKHLLKTLEEVENFSNNKGNVEDLEKNLTLTMQSVFKADIKLEPKLSARLFSFLRILRKCKDFSNNTTPHSTTKPHSDGKDYLFEGNTPKMQQIHISSRLSVLVPASSTLPLFPTSSPSGVSPLPSSPPTTPVYKKRPDFKSETSSKNLDFSEDLPTTSPRPQPTRPYEKSNHSPTQSSNQEIPSIIIVLIKQILSQLLKQINILLRQNTLINKELLSKFILYCENLEKPENFGNTEFNFKELEEILNQMMNLLKEQEILYNHDLYSVALSLLEFLNERKDLGNNTSSFENLKNIFQQVITLCEKENLIDGKLLSMLLFLFKAFEGKADFSNIISYCSRQFFSFFNSCSRTRNQSEGISEKPLTINKHSHSKSENASDIFGSSEDSEKLLDAPIPSTRPDAPTTSPHSSPQHSPRPKVSYLNIARKLEFCSDLEDPSTRPTLVSSSNKCPDQYALSPLSSPQYSPRNLNSSEDLDSSEDLSPCTITPISKKQPDSKSKPLPNSLGSSEDSEELLDALIPSTRSDAPATSLRPQPTMLNQKVDYLDSNPNNSQKTKDKITTPGQKSIKPAVWLVSAIALVGVGAIVYKVNPNAIERIAEQISAFISRTYNSIARAL